MGSRRLEDLFIRYGRNAVEACFDENVAPTTETYRREILTRIPPGTWTWEDYAGLAPVLRNLASTPARMAELDVDEGAADQETIRYTGVYGTDGNGEPYLMREVPGGGSGGRPFFDRGPVYQRRCGGSPAAEVDWL